LSPPTRTLCEYDSGQRDDGDLGGAAADVHDHVAARLGDRKSRANRGGHGLFDQVDLACACAFRALLDRAFLDLSDTEGDANHDPGLDQRSPAVRAGNEVPQHLLRDLEVGDDPVPQWPDGANVPRRAPEHLLGLAPDRQDGVDPASILLDRDDRGLA